MKITDALDQLLRALTSQEDEQAAADVAKADAASPSEVARPPAWTERNAGSAAGLARPDATSAPSAPLSAREAWETAEAAARKELAASESASAGAGLGGSEPHPSSSGESALPSWVRGLQERIGVAADTESSTPATDDRPAEAASPVAVPTLPDEPHLAVGDEVVLDDVSQVEAEPTAASDEAEPALAGQAELSDHVSPGAVEEGVVLDETSPVAFEDQVASSDVSPVAVDPASDVHEYSSTVEDHSVVEEPQPFGAAAHAASEAESAAAGTDEARGEEVALVGAGEFEFAHLEASAKVVESLKLGFHLGSAVQRIASAAVLGRDGVSALRESVWFIERYVALLERRPVGADIHLSSARLADAGEAIAGLKALAAAMDRPAGSPSGGAGAAGDTTSSATDRELDQSTSGWSA